MHARMQAGEGETTETTSLCGRTLVAWTTGASRGGGGVCDMNILLSPAASRDIRPLDFNVSLGRLRANGLPFSIKGVEWKGMEESLAPFGLNVHPMDYYLSFLQSEGFNSIRLPFNVDSVIKNSILIEDACCSEAPELVNLPYLNIMRAVVKAAARRGIQVVLASTRLEPRLPAGVSGSGLWYSEAVTEPLVERAWDLIADGLCSMWNVAGVDLSAQPFRATWATGNALTDWDAAATRLGNRVLTRCKRWLVFVQGVGTDPGVAGQSLEGGAMWGGASPSGAATLLAQ